MLKNKAFFFFLQDCPDGALKELHRQMAFKIWYKDICISIICKLKNNNVLGPTLDIQIFLREKLADSDSG